MKFAFVDIATYTHELHKAHETIHRSRRLASDLISEKVTGVPLPFGKTSFSRGLLIFASWIKRLGGRVNYVHYCHETEVSLRSLFKESDVVCLYVMTPTAQICLNVAALAKDANPKVVVALGGPHVASQGFELLENEGIDFVCFDSNGVVSAAAALLDSKQLSNCPGIGYKNLETGKIAINEIAENLETDNAELVDYGILPLPLNDYYLNLSASQGCAYSCSFCSDGTRRFRVRPVQDVMSEVLYLEDQLEEGAWIHFFDTIFTVPEARAHQLCDRLIESTRKLFFSCDIKANHITSDLARKLKSARFKFLSIGFETSDDDSLALNNKQNVFADCCATAELVKNSAPDCAVKAYWLLGLPGSSPSKAKKDIQQIEKLLDRRVVDIVGPKCFVPYPETVFFQRPEDFNLKIWTKDWNCYDRFHLPPVSTPSSFTRNQLAECLIEAERAVLMKYCQRLRMSISDVLHIKGLPKRYNGALYSRLIP